MGHKRRKQSAVSSSQDPVPPPPARENTPASFGIRFLKNEHYAEFERIKTRGLVPTRFLDFGMLDTLGLRTDVGWIAQRLGWTTFLQFREPTYKGLTLEFLSTLDAQVFQGFDSTAGLCTFRLGNVDRALTLADISVVFGFPVVTDSLVPRGETRVDFCDPATFWRKIGSGIYCPTKTKASSISNPALRVFHRFMAHTIFARGDGGENIATKKEVIVLCAALLGHQINSAAFLMNHLSVVSNRPSGVIAVGGLVTRLARHFDIVLDERHDLLDPPPIGFHLFRNMRLLHKYHQTWYWAFPSSKKLLRLPCSDRVSLLQQSNWLLVPRPSDLTHERLQAGCPSDPPMELEDDDIASGPDLGALIGSLHRDVTDSLSSIHTQLTLLNGKIDHVSTRVSKLEDKVDRLRTSEWRFCPPRSPQG